MKLWFFLVPVAVDAHHMRKHAGAQASPVASSVMTYMYVLGECEKSPVIAGLDHRWFGPSSVLAVGWTKGDQARAERIDLEVSDAQGRDFTATSRY